MYNLLVLTDKAALTVSDCQYFLTAVVYSCIVAMDA